MVLEVVVALALSPVAQEVSVPENESSCSGLG